VTRPLLFYADGCPKCRVLSRLIVGATAGVLRRVPAGGPEAAAWYDRHPGHRGRLMLIRGDDSVVLGRWVYPAMPAVVVRAWSSLVRWAAADVAARVRPPYRTGRSAR